MMCPQKLPSQRGALKRTTTCYIDLKVTLLVLAALAGGVYKVIRTNDTGRQEGQRTLEEWSLSTSQGKTQVDLAGVGNNECNTVSSSKKRVESPREC